MVYGFIFTIGLFFITILLLPLFGLLYTFLNIWRKIWLSFVSVLYPNVDCVKEVTVRSLLDTHRNQGILTVLLTVKGQPQPEAVRRHLQEVVNRRNKLGGLAFPRLRHSLVTKCGTYAWQNVKFDLDQNLTVALNMYKGRPVAEYNIQDYASEIVAKYLPTGVSPWQFIIIPSTEDYHYILLKIHHLLLSEGLNIGDLLPLLPPTKSNTGADLMKSPLVNVFKKFVYIPMLKDRLNEEISNMWNEFVANFDPIERPELLKYSPTFSTFMAFVIISLVATYKECNKGFIFIKPDFLSRIKYIFLTAKRETLKRQVNQYTLFLSILITFSPKNLFFMVFNMIWKGLVIFPLNISIFIYAEIRAFYTCFSLKYCPYPRTVVGILYTYIPLLYNCLKEVVYFLSILISAPKTIVQDILLQKESLQTITLCGRKCIAWSDPVKIKYINSIAARTSSTGTEIMLSAVSMCLSNYFTQVNHPIPTDLPVTIRNISSNYIFATGPNIKPENAVSGILCLTLPVWDTSRCTSDMENYLQIRNKFNDAIEKQGLSHLLTLLQTKFGIITKFLPSTCMGIYLKYLSRKYSVSIAEITSRYPHVTQRTLWGREVLSVMYFRPPQANTSISLCLNEYADHVRLGVMCDAQLMPYHTSLVKGFSQCFQELTSIFNI